MKDVEELDQATRDVISEGRHALDPDPRIRERVRQRVLLELAASAGAASIARPALGQVAKWVLATAVVGGAASGIAYFQHAATPAAVRTPAPLVAPMAPARASHDVPAAPSASAAASAALEKPVASHAVVSAAPKRNDLGREVELLAATNAALNGGDAKRARKLLADYDRAFPNGVLQEERGAAEALLLCASKDSARSSAALARFAARWPRSPLKQRVERACAGTK